MHNKITLQLHLTLQQTYNNKAPKVAEHGVAEQPTLLRFSLQFNNLQHHHRPTILCYNILNFHHFQQPLLNQLHRELCLAAAVD